MHFHLYVYCIWIIFYNNIEFDAVFVLLPWMYIHVCTYNVNDDDQDDADADDDDGTSWTEIHFTYVKKKKIYSL